jgi:hypothetical protein
MGEVHLALDPRLGRKVAIKLLLFASRVIAVPFSRFAKRVFHLSD